MKDDDAYVDPTEAQGQTRPDYSHSRKKVGENQFMQKVQGGFAYRSAIDKTKWNYLDENGHETFNKQAHKGGTITQQPALDHVIQYAAINEFYHAAVEGQRNEAQQGRSRRNSLDLHDAFKGAVADPSNLRLVSHDEHVSQGGSKHMGGFSQKEQNDARDLFLKHLSPNASSSQELSVFHNSRPRSSVPLSASIFTPTTMNLRSRDPKK